MLRLFSGIFASRIAGLFLRRDDLPPPRAPLRALDLAESIAAVEYAIKTHEWFQSAFRLWLRFHITIAFILYGLLALHVWSGIHFGLRWFS
jgi:uncharacterized membrane protein YagU involved in acid resistance